MKLTLKLLHDSYTIYKFNPEADLPEPRRNSEFYSISYTTDEISVVCQESVSIHNEIEKSSGWRMLKIEGPLDFSLVGIIANISGILKDEQLSIFTISTYNTDYIMVKNYGLIKAIDALELAGHTITTDR